MRIAIVNNLKNIYLKTSNTTLRTGNSTLVFGFDTVLSINNKIAVYKKENEIYFSEFIKFENFSNSLLNKMRFSISLPYIVIFEDADMVIIEQYIDIIKVFSKLFPKKGYSGVTPTLYTWELKCYGVLLNIPVKDIKTDYSKRFNSFDLYEKYSDLDIVNFKSTNLSKPDIEEGEGKIGFLDLYEPNTKGLKEKLVIYDIGNYITVPNFIKEIYLLSGTIYLKISGDLSNEEDGILFDFISELFDSLISFDVEVEVE